MTRLLQNSKRDTVMSKLEELIQKYCPDGVEYKPLGEICEVLTGGEAPDNAIKGKEPIGDCIYPIYSNGVGDNALWGFAPSYRVSRVSVTFSSIGTIGCPTIREGYYTPIIRLKVIYPKDDSLVSVYFIKYALETVDFEQQKSSVPNINSNMIKSISIPVPPLPVQEEIVRVLDKFAELQAELQTELQAELQKRLQQYNYYRDIIFLFEGRSDVQWKKLGEIATQWYRGAGIKIDEVSEDGMPCIRYGEIHTTYNIWFEECVSHTDESQQPAKKYADYGDILFAITSEDIPFIGNSVAYIGKEKILVGGDIVVMKHTQNPKYMSYALSTSDAVMQKGKGKVKSKVVHTSVPSLQEIVVPIPSLEEQEKIASILDRFFTLTTDLSQGLPAEIEKRRQQYEFYRDKLLTFKRKEA